VEVVEVEPVWSAHHVGFSLLTEGEDQYVAYYDAQRQMTVAHRKVAESKWTFKKLPQRTGWDSHNYVAMAMDQAGHLHVSGDMHNVPLIYFRTTRAGDVESLERVQRMTGVREKRVTYPVFMERADGSLVFRYRDGGSGNGDDLYNVYDVASRTWKPLIDGPLVSGEGQMSAYCTQPRLGEDGYYHMVYIWRDTPDAATNHHVCYARSRDLVTWEAADGRGLALPITFKSSDVVDPVPAGGGAINGNVRVGLDHGNRPVVTYLKYDAAGKTQAYAARFEEGRWVSRQMSRWDYRWDFKGNGTLRFEVNVGRVERDVPGRLVVGYSHPHGSGRWVLEDGTLEVVAGARPMGASGLGVPGSFWKTVPTVAGMRRHVAGDVSSPDTRGVDTAYFLTWQTLGTHQDRPIPEPLPEPTMLRVVKVSRMVGPAPAGP
jgi:hypothetical protein